MKQSCQTNSHMPIPSLRAKIYNHLTITKKNIKDIFHT